MGLSQGEFDILVFLEEKQDEKLSVNDIADATNYQANEVVQYMEYLLDNALIKNIDGYQLVTKKGYEWLEPYRVKRALFMAAGAGRRMVPITINTPKPLIRVNGKPIIETLLDAVIRAGIEDIIIVRGHLGEQFDLLLKKYPMLKFIDNPVYDRTNNISSAFYFKDLMENAYVLESDLVLNNHRLIRKYEYSTNYLGMKVDYTDDWCFKVENGIIKEVLIGGHDVYHMYGISYWNKEDAKKMRMDIPKVYNSEGGKQKFWDEVALKDCAQNYQIMVRTVQKGDIIEIDTFEELKALDHTYAG